MSPNRMEREEGNQPPEGEEEIEEEVGFVDLDVGSVDLEDERQVDLHEIDPEQILAESEGLTPEEFHAINNQLDQLNAALDFIERRNDDLQGKAKELLESIRKTRMDSAQDQNDKIKD